MRHCLLRWDLRLWAVCRSGAKLNVDNQEREKAMTVTDAKAEGSTDGLKVGDTLTVVSGRLGGVWMAEDDNGVVYTVAPVE